MAPGKTEERDTHHMMARNRRRHKLISSLKHIRLFATDVDVRADEMTPCATCEANRDLLDRAARGDLSDRLPGQ